MLRKKLDRPVLTLADACEADFLVVVKCERCETRRQMHPFRLLSAHKRLLNAPLDTVLSRFFCKTCRSSVNASITCTFTHPGG